MGGCSILYLIWWDNGIYFGVAYVYTSGRMAPGAQCQRKDRGKVEAGNESKRHLTQFIIIEWFWLRWGLIGPPILIIHIHMAYGRASM